jgi:hypothetical protein
MREYDNAAMFTRRFVLLAVVLVALNVALWLATPGLALRRAVVKELFGPSMVRAEVIEKGGADWRLDRGVITSVSSTQVTLREADTPCCKIVTIPVSSTTKVIRLGRRLPLSALARRWHVLVTWPSPNGPAQSVDVERIPRVQVR